MADVPLVVLDLWIGSAGIGIAIDTCLEFIAAAMRVLFTPGGKLI